MQTEALKNDSNVQNKVKEQMVTNDELAEEVIKYLKSNPNTVNALKSIYKENEGSVTKIMEAVMKDPDLSKKAMDWMANNPELLNRILSQGK